MDSRFARVKVLIWDFDGTLYKAIPELWEDIREAEYRVIMHHTGWDYDRTEKEFRAIYKVTLSSATETAAHLSHISTSSAAIEMEDYYDRGKYLSRDERLLKLFKTLDGFTHYILGNGVKIGIEKTLRVLGVDALIFTEIVTSEITKINKPDQAGYRYIMQKTGLPADAHMMIGDRVDVDLVPAKTIGMKTCLVFGQSIIPDISLDSVYEISTLFI